MGKAQFVATVAILAAVAAILSRLFDPLAPSVASLALGTDDAFIAYGLEPRENLVGGGALRWTRPKAAFRFEDLEPGPVDLDLMVRDHRTELAITANGALVGLLRPGQSNFKSRLRLAGSPLTVGIETDGFVTSSGRTLGTQFVSLAVTPGATATGGASRLWTDVAVLSVAGVAIQMVLRLSPLMAALPPILLVGLVIPAGLWRSGWIMACALLLAAAMLASALVVRAAKGGLASKACLQIALIAGLTVHGILPPSPLVIQQDAQLHGNKLAEVARGNLFPTTRTDHRPPFEIPYGFSFYGLLAPLASSDSNVAIVREAAALFTALSLLA